MELSTLIVATSTSITQRKPHSLSPEDVYNRIKRLVNIEVAHDD